MNAREIKKAWDEILPVVVCRPNEKPVECSYIKEITYYRSPRGGKKQVSCLCQDANCPHSVVRASGRHIKLKE